MRRGAIHGGVSWLHGTKGNNAAMMITPMVLFAKEFSGNSAAERGAQTWSRRGGVCYLSPIDLHQQRDFMRES